MKKVKEFWQRFKNIKHIQIYLAVLIGLCVCAVYFGTSIKKKTDNKQDLSTENYSSSEEYVLDLQNRLSNVLSKISGAGQVSVIITLQSGFTYEYATETETKTSSSGGTETKVTTENVILVSGQPVVAKEIYPVVKGVVVVAKGAENVKVKMAIISAVETVLEVDQSDITILA